MAGLAKLPTLGQPLLEAHFFRQTQTAYTALIFHQEGIDLIRPEVPVFGPPWVLPFEFPIFQAGGAVLMNLGLAPDVAMRSLGLATFLVTGALIFGFLKRVADAPAAFVALAAFLFSPHGLLWGRTSLIEYLSVGAAVGFLWAGCTWRDSGGRASYVLALVAGALAVIVKSSTGLFYLLPLLAYRGRPPSTRSATIGLAALVAIPAVVGTIWTGYADATKQAIPATAWLASSSPILQAEHFGGLDDRLSPATWAGIGAVIHVLMAGNTLVPLLPLAAARIWRSPQRRFLATLVLVTGAAPLLIFTHAHYLHDYYQVAVAPSFAALVGLGGSWLWGHRRSLAARAAILGIALIWAVTLVRNAEYWMQSYQPVVDRTETLAAAEYVASRTAPDDLVVIRGRGWDPSVLYYARRRGFMLHEWVTPDTLARLRDDPRYVLFLDCPYDEPCRPLDADAGAH